ncbi:MAG TPA: ABC transporter permease [Thermoanaerobaculia bacterium]|nr:ABC transporter permease [Thermoanaerobaculia bacterium]
MTNPTRAVRSLLRGKPPEGELDEEMRFHLEMEVKKNLERGMAPEEARREAMKSFGGVERFKDEVRDQSTAHFLETVLQDLRFGLRALRKNPAFSLAAILTLALGIGANTAIFSVVNGVLLQSLPYGGGERLVRLQADAPAASIQNAGFSPLDLADFRAQTKSFEGLVEYHSMWFVLLGRKEPERVQTAVVSANYFDVLGVKPILGRTFRKGEDAHGAEAVLVLSYAYWMRSFGGDPKVVGRVFAMNDHPHTVIGVLPPIPGYPNENDLYMPVSACPFRSNPRLENNRRGRMLTVFGRLKPEVTIAAARTELNGVAGRLAREYPDAYPKGGFLVTPVSLREEMTKTARPTFLILLSTVGLVLLLACANVANLSLARLIRREREMALRSALGADRKRLARQVLTESTVLGLLGGALGLLLARAGLHLLISFATRFTPRASEIHMEAPVLLFTLVISVVTGVALGLIPVMSRKKDLAASMNEGGERSTAGSGRHRVRNLLIVAQVAISFVLLIGAGLMVRSLWNLQRVDPGFQTERVLTMRMDLNFTKYDTADKRLAFHEQLLRRLQSEQGVVSASISGTFPLNDGNGPGAANGQFQIEGDPAVTEQELLPRADFQQASQDYFKTIQVPLLRGRTFDSRDRKGNDLVALINQTMANHRWPGKEAIGHRISFDQGKTWLTIVGIVGDVKQYELAAAPTDQIYLHLLQYPTLSSTILLRTVANPMAMSRIVSDTVHGMDPDQPVDHFRTLEQMRTNSLSSPRLTALLLALFALLALVITATGIMGVIAFSVSQRFHEFGIRMALGAQRGEVLTMVLRQGMSLVAIGLGIGLAGALLFSRLLNGLLYGVRPTDPLTFAAVAAVLLAVAAAACFFPARRATSADPMQTLRTA